MILGKLLNVSEPKSLQLIKEYNDDKSIKWDNICNGQCLAHNMYPILLGNTFIIYFLTIPSSLQKCVLFPVSIKSSSPETGRDPLQLVIIQFSLAHLYHFQVIILNSHMFGLSLSNLSRDTFPHFYPLYLLIYSSIHPFIYSKLYWPWRKAGEDFFEEITSEQRDQLREWAWRFPEEKHSMRENNVCKGPEIEVFEGQ